jgi:hypothetical protein
MTRIFITADYWHETRLGVIVRDPLFHELERNLSSIDYGSSIKKIGIILFCNDMEWKPRIRFLKKDLCLELDIVFDFLEMYNAEDFERKEIVGQRLLSDLEQIIRKYKFNDFDLPRFLHDFEGELKRIGYLSSES